MNTSGSREKFAGGRDGCRGACLRRMRSNKAYRADGTVPHAGSVGRRFNSGAGRSRCARWRCGGPAAAKEDFPWPCKPSVTEKTAAGENQRTL